MTIRWTVVKTPLGLLALASGERGLVAAWFVDAIPPANVLGERWPDAEIARDDKALAAARRQLEQYFAGKRRAFELPLDFGGTEWQRAVWREVRAIPFGETRTYRDVARAVGKPQAVRAVGAANGQNPVCIVVPCHRLIGSDGSLHGYGGGVERKRALLDLESRVTVASARSARARSRARPRRP
ncbi:MAG: methylated-DNA--[protein]-cysteine S-methyltransferase [Planctomycetes bacterium]|nr:methylated-DNA--[protein]-cysteine S-methyltransferase [Planctomycetota bacterium]